MLGLSKRKVRSAEIFYSNDERVLNSDEFFVKFAIGEADAMVLGDADHNLLARSRGNTELHRMLSVSDGLIRAQGRKMIFSTNLPNLRDLDDALVRPGRCHACLKLRSLTADEARARIADVCADRAHAKRACAVLGTDTSASWTIADLCRAVRVSIAATDVATAVPFESKAA